MQNSFENRLYLLIYSAMPPYTSRTYDSAVATLVWRLDAALDEWATVIALAKFLIARPPRLSSLTMSLGNSVFCL